MGTPSLLEFVHPGFREEIRSSAMPAKKKTPEKPTTLRQALASGGRFIEPQEHPTLCEVRDSGIHGSGVFATEALESGTKIIEYIGEKITKKQSDDRGWAQMERSKETGEAGVYLFTLNKRHDVDGHFPWNIARLINHTCDPNCEAYVTRGRIWIWSIRDIEKGEELGFNYGFDLESYEDHPCHCGSQICVGYICGEDYWDELKGKLAER